MFGYACLVSAILCEHRRGSSACLVILCTHIESLSIVECDQARPDPQALVAAFIEWRPVRACPMVAASGAETDSCGRNAGTDSDRGRDSRNCVVEPAY